MNSIFTSEVDLNSPFKQHPNPYFERRDFMVLDGWWDFEVNQQESTEAYSKKIVVPFAPETPLSQIGMHINANDYMHYRKSFRIDPKYIGSKALLHFVAVDQECIVNFNGKKLGEHKGGYTSFSFVIDSVQEDNVIEVVARDDTDSEIYARGKQSNDRGGIWYTPTSGIWGDVYIEFIPEAYIEDISIKSSWKNKKVVISAKNNLEKVVSCSISLQNVTILNVSLNSDEPAEIDLSDHFVEWSPDAPNLYDVTFKLGDDQVQSHFGFRHLEGKEISGTRYLFLNNKPIFLSSLLDQGYWPDGGLTAPCEKAISYDIDKIKEAGFNCLRKHIKIESMRWYYECDTKGVLVIQDLVNSGSKYSKFLINTRPFINYDINDIDNKILGRGNPDSMVRYETDMYSTIKQLSSPTCICIWTLFNEGWGQFRAKEMYQKMKECVGDCLIDATSGWYDKGVGDFNSRHIYFRAPKPKTDHKRILSLSEFGGYSLPSDGHMFTAKTFGYATYKDNSKLNNAIEKVYKRDLIKAIVKDGLSISVYTQISDVEDEINGLMTYDRAIFKPDMSLIQECNSLLYKTYEETVEDKLK